MTEFRGRPGPVGRIAILVSQYHERITRRLLDGARDCCRDAGLPEDRVDEVSLSDYPVHLPAWYNESRRTAASQ